jgi:mRNA interferase YafQ
MKICRSSRFKKDYKKAKKQKKNIALLKKTITKLANNIKLEEKFRDHSLRGNWRGYRDVHLESDWILIYKKSKSELRLARLGSHSELFKK